MKRSGWPFFAMFACLAWPQYVDGQSKLENGLRIVWNSTAPRGAPDPADYDPEAKIEVFESSGRKLTVCRVVEALRAANVRFDGISIFDVAAKRSDFIAVAAVYSRADGSPVALLLYFDWNGKLTRKIVVDERPEIEALEMDDHGQVWALNSLGADSRSPSVFTVFDGNGTVVKDVVKPRRGWSTDESMTHGGQISLGLVEGRVWAWLPKTGVLILADQGGQKAVVRRTRLPQIGGGSNVYAQEARLEDDGRLVMVVGWHKDGRFQKGQFVWSPGNGWQRAS